MLTTFLSYGGVAGQRQGKIIRNLATCPQVVQPGISELARAIVREMRSVIEIMATDKEEDFHINDRIINLTTCIFASATEP